MWILDACLLMALLAILVVVPRWLKQLKGLREELQRLSLCFVQATNEAGAAIEELRALTTTEQQSLHEARKKALSTADDLEFLRQKAENLCSKLEAVAAAGRPVTRRGYVPETPAPAVAVEPTSKAEEALKEAMRHV
ncbi:MAG: DUF6468 domain-containing protein [Holosporales bacterium]|jgi:hypothetical protein